jgi:hypothetical protein
MRYLYARLICSLLTTMGVLQLVPQPLADALGVAEDFGLIDQHGQFHRLSYHRDDPETRAIVVFTHGIGCPLVRKRYVDLQHLATRYEPNGIRFWMLNANDQDQRADLEAEALDFGVTLPILDDVTQEVARSLDVDRTGEAILIETANWNILFRGPIDDRLGYEKEKSKPTRSYLRDSIDNFLGGKPIETSRVDAPGCLISFPSWEAHLRQPVRYADEVAPLIQEKCVICHRAGGIAPFAFSSYRKARGWADMMREVLLTRRMPPWQADPYHGDFDRDLSLTPEQKQVLLHWIEQGAPRGDGGDPLASSPPDVDAWSQGKPHHMIELPAQEVPAQGLVDYRYVHLTSPFESDTWIVGADIQPGDRQALHHVIAFILSPDGSRGRGRKWLTGYAPGVRGGMFPENTGILLRKKERLLFEMHYTPYGRETVDQTRLGLYTADEKPAHTLQTGIFIDESIRIPAGDRAFERSQSRMIRQDMILYSMNPHMHLRGKAMRFELETPDGQKEILVSVPDYNFNWQHTYFLSEPLRVPKGSRLSLHATWDNSSLNPSNPDSERAVGWGEQSFDEMFFGTYQFVRDRGQSLVGTWNPVSRSLE